ncbi:MAG: orotate phosphoribosyltransferase [Eubacteriaceae bacterium]|jgi:orotate phosphoribosyltransferase|nr:orotate phosphoribosyltransferase [Eubacteriaceae bacterium]
MKADKININSTEEIIAEKLLKIGAVFLRPDDPFTWASGIKSPIYCDNRLILSAPKVRNVVEESIAMAIDEIYPECEVIMGTSTAGIAHAALAANLLGLPMGYVRGKAKDHGRTNQIEGRLEKGQKVVVVEDLISTGGSVIETVEALREAGGDVLGIISIFTYGLESSIEAFREKKIKAVSLCNLDVLVDVAVRNKYIEFGQKNKILSFRSNPEHWYVGL